MELLWGTILSITKLSSLQFSFEFEVPSSWVWEDIVSSCHAAIGRVILRLTAGLKVEVWFHSRLSRQPDWPCCWLTGVCAGHISRQFLIKLPPVAVFESDTGMLVKDQDCSKRRLFLVAERMCFVRTREARVELHGAQWTSCVDPLA